MPIGIKKTINARAYKKAHDEVDMARKVISDSVRNDLSKILLDDTRDFKENLLDVLTDIKVTSLLAAAKADPEIVNVKPNIAKAMGLLARPRFDEAQNYLVPSLGPDLVGRGWHQPQMASNSNHARWSGPTSLSSILLKRLQPGTYLVEGNIRFYVDASRGGFKVKLGDNFVTPSIEAVGDRWKFVAKTKLLGSDRSSFSRIEFFCPQLNSPKALEGTNDDRMIGFFLSDLIISRV